NRDVTKYYFIFHPLKVDEKAPRAYFEPAGSMADQQIQPGKLVQRVPAKRRSAKCVLYSFMPPVLGIYPPMACARPANADPCVECDAEQSLNFTS
ncbi:MAG: hypothetical protein QMD99_02330, partial [Rhizobiaceae bacterium]|nr:hypothetical protein [Rhizobiaceae bacterium]